MTLGHVIMTADVLSLPISQQAYDLQMATTYYSAPYNPATPLPTGEQLEATRADGDAVFTTMIEIFLAGLAAGAQSAPEPRRANASARGSAKRSGR
jgi:hypothetical protein